MEKFVVLKNGAIYNLGSNKRLKITIKTGDKNADVDKMSETMSKFFSVMTKDEFMENWLLTISLMLKNEEIDSENDLSPINPEDLEEELDRMFQDLSEDLEVVKKNVSGDDISNYVTAFVLGRMFGKFEKNTGAKVTIEQVDIDSEEHEIIQDFISSLDATDDYSVPDDEMFDGTAYFELDDFTED